VNRPGTLIVAAVYDGRTCITVTGVAALSVVSVVASAEVQEESRVREERRVRKRR
jgi:hypothetical protein